jgi:hypothetical protein
MQQESGCMYDCVFVYHCTTRESKKIEINEINALATTPQTETVICRIIFCHCGQAVIQQS